MRQLMAQFPGAHLAASLQHAVLRLAEMVQPLLHEQVQRQRQPRQPVAQNAVVDIAATGEITGQRRRPLPRLPPAARVLIIAVGQRLAAGQPQSLDQKQRQQSSSDALRQIEAKAAETCEPVGHRDQSGFFQSKRRFSFRHQPAVNNQASAAL
jgi:hypothetical protein